MLLPSADREPCADANGITATPWQQARVVPNTARQGHYVVPFAAIFHVCSVRRI